MNVSADKGLFKLYTLYFKVNGTITPDTFSLWSDGITNPYGAVTGTTEPTTYGAYMVGFPVAEKELATYTGVEGYVLSEEPSNKTDSSTWSYLSSGASVQIWYGEDGKADTVTAPGTATTYKVSTDSETAGQLLNAADNTKASLTLIEGEAYRWTVTPTDTQLAAASGTITATKNGDTVIMWAQKAEPVTYTLTVGSENGNLQGATVTVKDSSGNAVTVSNNGKTDTVGTVTFEGYPGLTYSVEISADGYGSLSGTVTTSSDKTNGKIETYGGELQGATNSNGQIVLTAPKTSIKVTVRYMSDDEESADGTVSKANVTVVGNSSQSTDTNGEVTLALGDGTYTLRASGGGRGTGVSRSLVINGTTVTLDGTTITANGGVYEVELRVGPKLSDPVYEVVGEWVDENDHSKGMTFTVSINNVTTAQNGTFGFQWDSNVFELADGAFKPSDVIEVPGTTEGQTYPITNPMVPVDGDETSAQYQYHAFYWQAKSEDGTFSYLDSSSGAVKIAEYTLTVANGVDDIDKVLNDKTVTARSFLKTSGAAETRTEFGAMADDALSYFWQDITDTEFRNEPEYRIDDDKALDGGFYQIFQTLQGDAANVSDATVHSQDIMMTIEYPSSNLAVKFNVADVMGNPIAGAQVTLQDENGNPIKDADGNDIVGQTDIYGDVTLQVPTGDESELQEYYYSVRKAGFEKYPNDTEKYPTGGVQLKDEADENGELPDVIQVILVADDSAKVYLNPSDRLNLLGSDRAAYGEPYLFSVDAKAGYTLKDGGLQTSDFSVQIWKITEDYVDGTDPNSSSEATKDTEHAVLTVTWDSTKNSFKIDGIDFSEGYLIEIIVEDEETNVPVESDGYKVYAQADSAGGFFTVDPIADGSKFYAGTDTTLSTEITSSVTTTAQNDTIEVLKGGNESTAAGTTSSTYFIQTNGPVQPGYSGTDATKINAIDNVAQEAADGIYYGYVINKLYVNGVEISLTDAERIHGVEETLVNIAEDQQITVTYMIAKIDGKDTENPADDEIINDDPEDPDYPPVAVGDAVVTVVLGERGTAKVSYDSVTNASQAGSTTVDYQVEGATFKAVLTADTNVANPDGSGDTTDYEIDKVYVIIDDGDPQCIFSDDDPSAAGAVTAVTPLPAGVAYSNGTVDLSNLESGKHITVLVTFKVDGEEAMQAWVETVNLSGNGNISPSGLKAYNIGAEPVYTIMPDPSWTLSVLTVQVGSGSANGRKSDAVQQADGSYTYKMEALQAGTTKLAYAFTENAYRVDLTVHYGDMTLTKVPYTHATITYTRTAGGDGTAQSGTIVVPATVSTQNVCQEYTMNLQAGTWTITVSKRGYLPFTVTDFVINTDGTVDGTKQSNDSGVSVIYFGTEANASDGTDGKHYIAPKLGDADWNETSITLRDISQMINGMSTIASSASKAHADIDESGYLTGGSYDLTDDYGYVLAAYGDKWTDYVMTYEEFMGNAKYNPALNN